MKRKQGRKPQPPLLTPYFSPDMYCSSHKADDTDMRGAVPGGPHGGPDLVVVFLPFPTCPFLMSDKLFAANLRWSNCGRTIPPRRVVAQALPHVPEKSEVFAGNAY